MKVTSCGDNQEGAGNAQPSLESILLPLKISARMSSAVCHCDVAMLCLTGLMWEIGITGLHRLQCLTAREIQGDKPPARGPMSQTQPPYCIQLTMSQRHFRAVTCSPQHDTVTEKTRHATTHRRWHSDTTFNWAHLLNRKPFNPKFNRCLAPPQTNGMEGCVEVKSDPVERRSGGCFFFFLASQIRYSPWEVINFSLGSNTKEHNFCYGMSVALFLAAPMQKKKRGWGKSMQTL